MKGAIQYLTNNKVRISGYTVVTAEEAVRACEIASSEEKEAAVQAFCKAVCGAPCAAKACEMYKDFIGQIDYKPTENKWVKKPPFEDQLLF